MLFGVAYGQVCADEDTVRSNAVTLITANTARVNGTVSHFTGAPTSLQLRYVRVGQTDTATASSTPTSALRNLTGLQAGTAYYYYYKTICGSGTRSQTIGAYTFTTLANTIFYAPERPTVFNHVKVDSSMIIPAGDTVVGREPSTGAQIRYKTSNNTFYGYYPSCTCWRPLAIDSAGIIALLDGKVDSVTVSSDSLFYWKVGVSYGYILPALNDVWRNTGNTGIDTSVNWLGTNDAKDLVIKTNNTRKFTINGNGALGIGNPADYGTSGYVLKSLGSGSATAWVDYTLQQALSREGNNAVITAPTDISPSSDTYDLIFGDATLWNTIQFLGKTDILLSSGNAHSSQLLVLPDSIVLKPYGGYWSVDSLPNLSSQNTLMGWRQGSGQGQVGYVTLSGLTLSSGVLTNPITASSTTTFTNKRWTARVGSTTSSATPTINTDNVDIYKLTAQTADITSFTTNLSGSPADGDILEIQVTGTAARAITWGASFVSTTVTLPTTTVTTATLTIVFQYYTTSSYGNNKWACVNYY